MSRLIESATLCLALPTSAALAACTPSPQEAAMHRTSPAPDTAFPAPVAETVSAGENAGAGPAPSPASPQDTVPEAAGRRILSTAFVRIGADGHLTVELRDGRELVLRDVAMHARKYCGILATGDGSGTKFCGSYADVAAARAGGAPVAVEPVSEASTPIKPASGGSGH